MYQFSKDEFDLNNWKDYDDLYTHSLWLIDSRDSSGKHSNHYHGNFVPQIASQLIRRFTKFGDVILDPFLGSGTSLIEAKRLGRAGIGIELLPHVAKLARQKVDEQDSQYDLDGFQKIFTGDAGSNTVIKKVMAQLEGRKASLLILHPPYHDIIKFSDDPRCLSNSATSNEFITNFVLMTKPYVNVLSKGSHVALIIGDKYANSQLVPLAFLSSAALLETNSRIRLKSIIVKNIANTKGKLGQQRLWRYRSFRGGFYTFGHEYIFLYEVFQ